MVELIVDCSLLARTLASNENQVEDAHAKKKAKKEKKEKKSKGDETVDAGNVTTVTEADVTVAGDEKKKAKKDKKDKDEVGLRPSWLASCPSCSHGADVYGFRIDRKRPPT
jgi:hypothetical protein